ncbi:MAG: molybdopterin cofactor-binding domain-containing protein, partial [Kofleriaceae bacterium]
MVVDGIGASIKRKEDRRFLLGKGNYTDDITLPQQTYAVFVRSMYAHAKIASIDTAAAKAAPGVVGVLTGEDVAADGLGGLPCGWLVKNKDGSNMVEPPHPALAHGKVRHVGDPVVMVIATTKAAAHAAAGLVEINYDVLSGVGLLADAVKPGAPVVWDEAPGNLCYDWHIGDPATTDAGFAKAAHVIEIDLTNSRVAPNAMEPRAANGHYDSANDHYTL